MVREIKLNGIATFTEPEIMKPLKINFCYGSNGSGKTTISTAISDFSKAGVEVLWLNSTPLQTLIYNRDFVIGNFSETSKINGIFTLGKESKEAREFISEQKAKANECVKQIEGFIKSKEQLIKEQQKRESNFDDACWKVKEMYDTVFDETFNGLNHSKKLFRERCLSEAKKAVSAEPNQEELKRQYKIAFGEARPLYSEFNLVDITLIEQWEKCDLLSQKITGSSDTPIGKLIEYLRNSDWIKEGIPYADKAEGKCPFCQQVLAKNTYDDIKAFFDDSYERDLNQIKAFLDRYSQKTKDIISTFQGYADVPLTILDYSLFKAELATLVLKVDNNIKEIKRKANSPMTEVTIESICSLIERINELLTGFNKSIAESNDFSKNQKAKQNECINSVWQLVVSNLTTTMDIFNKETIGNEQGINNLDDKITEQKNVEIECNRLITDKEAALTSIKPTADAINSILIRFGFEGFSIEENPDEIGTYKIVRSDGKNVEKTLSEGEYNFICFLYFYHLVYGSQSKIGTAQSKIVVIDDPISSFDSNVLFIVSTLTRQIVDDCKNDHEGIKQVFILTHNVYFHKEVAFLGSGKHWKNGETAFWIVKKVNNISHIIDHGDKNPIQTSYELLWSEVKETEGTQRITIFNTLRRILEYYFNVIGGLDYEKCINEFDGEDKLICKSLIACINEGSHFITDDFVMQYESAAMNSYIRVFSSIFEKMGHISHYNMMMGITPEEQQEKEPTHE